MKISPAYHPGMIERKGFLAREQADCERQPHHLCYLDLGGGTDTSGQTYNTVTTTSTIPEKTATEIAAEQAALKQILAQGNLSDQYKTVITQMLQDSMDEYTVRLGGKVTDIMKATPWAKLTGPQITAELRKDEKFIKQRIDATPAVKAVKGKAAVIDKKTGKVITPAVKGVAAVAAKPAKVIYDEKAIAAEAKRRLATKTEVDTDATGLRQKYFDERLGKEKTAADAATQKTKDAEELAKADRVRQTQLEDEIAGLSKRQTELLDRQTKTLDDAAKGPTEDQIKLIDEATGSALRAGEADIERFRTATLRQINEEVASASGLRSTDTPVLRLSERAGEESARQQGILARNAAEENARMRLNFPLQAAGVNMAGVKLSADIGAGAQGLLMAREKLSSDLSARTQATADAASQFQAQLEQQANQNRFRLFSAAPQFNATNAAGFASSLGQQRILSAGKTQFSQGGTSISKEEELGFADILGGIGGALGTFSDLGGLAGIGSLFSDRRLKRNIRRVGTHPCGVPLYEFEYIWGGARRIGVIADEVLRVNPDAVGERAGYLTVNYAAL